MNENRAGLGYQDFEEVREKHIFYIDKTNFIKECGYYSNAPTEKQGMFRKAGAGRLEGGGAPNTAYFPFYSEIFLPKFRLRLSHIFKTGVFNKNTRP